MNIFNKILLGALILGTGTQAINAHPWTTKTIAAVTLAGLGLGTAGTIKYYGFNSIANAALEKCANAKNWFSNRLSDAIFGSYKKQLQTERAAKTAVLEAQADTQAKLKEAHHKALAEKEAQLEAQEARIQEEMQHAKNVTTSRRLNAIELTAKIKKAHDAQVALRADHAQLKADVRKLLDAYNIDLTDLINNMPHLQDYLAFLQNPVIEQPATQE